MGQTVNLLVFTFGGSNPSLPTIKRVPVGVQSPKDNKQRSMQRGCGDFCRRKGVLSKAAFWLSKGGSVL